MSVWYPMLFCVFTGDFCLSVSVESFAGKQMKWNGLHSMEWGTRLLTHCFVYLSMNVSLMWQSHETSSASGARSPRCRWRRHSATRGNERRRRGRRIRWGGLFPSWLCLYCWKCWQLLLSAFYIITYYKKFGASVDNKTYFKSFHHTGLRNWGLHEFHWYVVSLQHWATVLHLRWYSGHFVHLWCA